MDRPLPATPAPPDDALAHHQPTPPEDNPADRQPTVPDHARADRQPGLADPDGADRQPGLADPASPHQIRIESGPDSTEPSVRPPAAQGDLSAAEHHAIDAVLGLTDWAIPHVRQVCTTAGRLFDALRDLHGYGPAERRLLLTAALLHDVGYPSDPGRHHKVSARIVRSHLGPPFDGDDIETIALLTRYHRKTPPRLRHRRYAALDQNDRRRINWLGGILRVADGLDRSHAGSVGWLVAGIVDGRLEVRIGPRRSTATGAAAAAVAAALQTDAAGAMRKRDLLERAVGLPVLVRAP